MIMIKIMMYYIAVLGIKAILMEMRIQMVLL